MAAIQIAERQGTLAVTRKVLALMGLLAAFAGVWLLAIPTSLGGSVSYVITDGTSMLPNFHANGVVITRKQSSYEVGDVVAYHNKDLDAVVMHRIVARDGGRYVFKGDNNNFRDEYHPTKSELIGEEWVYWPGAGKYLKMLREPLMFAVVLGAVTLLSLRMPKPRRRRRRHHAW